MPYGVIPINFDGRKNVPVIHQAEKSECGLVCLAMVAGFYGHDVNLARLRQSFPAQHNGLTIRVMVEAGDSLGLVCRPIAASVDQLASISLPIICHWNDDHYVVLSSVRNTVRGRRYVVNDPATGRSSITKEEFAGKFTGALLEITVSDRFEKRREAQKLGFRQLWTKTIGLKTTVLELIALSFLFQLMSLASPLYMQEVVDSAIPALDLSFLNVLAIGFALLAFINLVTATLRDFIILRFGSALGYQLVVNLFRHLSRLPIPYFERRHVGDVISRFESAQPITDLLTHGLIQGLIDGILTAGTLALMFYFSPLLAGTALIAFMALILVKITFFNALRTSNTSAIAAKALESSTMIETIRGIAAIKIFGRESERQRIWQNKRAAMVNAQIRNSRTQIWSEALTVAISGIENVVFIYLAARMTIEGSFTVGMIFSFQLYKNQFLSATTRLTNQYVQLKLLDVHLTRIADIALTPLERDGSRRLTLDDVPLQGGIEIKNLRFAYGVGGKEILRGVNLKVEPGDSIAITGPSGCGKTTLLKILLGYYPPTKGAILIDGQRIQKFGLRRFRSQVGTVLQDDVLYAGTLAENISFFSDDIDLKRVRVVAETACCHADIVAMPMGYETLVGDMGSSLSGGQRQRILLARALYAAPRILLMDEGTAHLDLATEAAVNSSLSQLGITRVVIAHRSSTIASANRVVRFADGVLTEVPKKMPRLLGDGGPKTSETKLPSNRTEHSQANA